MQQVPKLLFLRGPGHRNLSVNVDLPPLKQSSLKSTKVLRWSLSPKLLRFPHESLKAFMRWTGHNTFRSATVANTAAAMLCLAITCCLIGPGMLVVIVRLFATFPHFATLGLLVTRHFACLQGGTRLAPGEAQVLWRREICRDLRLGGLGMSRRLHRRRVLGNSASVFSVALGL